MKTRFLFFLAGLLLVSCCFAQEEKPEISLTLGYHASNNKIPYLLVNSRYRNDKSFEVVKGAAVRVYITEESEENLVGQVVTDENGFAKLILPAAIQNTWKNSSKQLFLAVAKESQRFAETRTEVEITKTRISIDTLITDEGKRAVAVTVEAMDEEGSWLPASDVELRVGVKRLASLLPVGEEATYTTDSTGLVVATFQRDSLPAQDESGTITIGVKVEENEQFGNLSAEGTVPWGVFYKQENKFDKRSLWATRDKTPIWLLLMAYSIIAAVWGVIAYLLYLLVVVVRVGKRKPFPAGVIPLSKTALSVPGENAETAAPV